MTPRIKEMNPESDLNWFSEALFSQLNQKGIAYDLSGDGALYTIRHPALIKTQYLFEHSPGQLVFHEYEREWNVIFYQSLHDAQKENPQTVNFNGFPCHIYRLQEQKPDCAIIDFRELGAVYLSRETMAKTSLPHALHHYLLSQWLDYALSAELWGPYGKWVRFHGRLHTLFTKYGLLNGKDIPGYYPLKMQAHWLSHFGFNGKLDNNSFDLTLPWDFPLSGLVALEKVLARGP